MHALVLFGLSLFLASCLPAGFGPTPQVCPGVNDDGRSFARRSAHACSGIESCGPGTLTGLITAKKAELRALRSS